MQNRFIMHSLSLPWQSRNDEMIPFLDARPVKPDEEAYYDLPNRSEESATLYQHCVRAIERSLQFGAHGLPLMGSGDWNDGMNEVGKDGRGDPPFDTTPQNPGYIKGYIPGVRENGGQYTHAAIWTATAYALMGDSERAWELFSLLNPIHHSATPSQITTYKVEPYVVAADVYALAPHTGRGGWTWYTGAAAWMYRLLVENLLGVSLEGDQLRLNPLLPESWPSFKIHYRYRQTTYHITVTRLAADAAGVHPLSLDGQEMSGNIIPLQDDRIEHAVEIKVR